MLARSRNRAVSLAWPPRPGPTSVRDAACPILLSGPRCHHLQQVVADPARHPSTPTTTTDQTNERSHTDSAQHHPNPHSATHRRNPTTTPPTATPNPPKTTTTEHHLQSLTNARTRVDTLAGSARRNPTGAIPGVITERVGARLEVRRVHRPACQVPVAACHTGPHITPARAECRPTVQTCRADLPCRPAVQTYRADLLSFPRVGGH